MKLKHFLLLIVTLAVACAYHPSSRPLKTRHPLLLSSLPLVYWSFNNPDPSQRYRADIGSDFGTLMTMPDRYWDGTTNSALSGYTAGSGMGSVSNFFNTFRYVGDGSNYDHLTVSFDIKRLNVNSPRLYWVAAAFEDETWVIGDAGRLESSFYITNTSWTNITCTITRKHVACLCGSNSAVRVTIAGWDAAPSNSWYVLDNIQMQ